MPGEPTGQTEPVPTSTEGLTSEATPDALTQPQGAPLKFGETASYPSRTSVPGILERTASDGMFNNGVEAHPTRSEITTDAGDVATLNAQAILQEKTADRQAELTQASEQAAAAAQSARDASPS